jgi:hypothetical protein
VIREDSKRAADAYSAVVASLRLLVSEAVHGRRRSLVPQRFVA